MTVVTTADTSQLYALAARHGLKLHGPLTVNELGLDYRIVIATCLLYTSEPLKVRER